MTISPPAVAPLVGVQVPRVLSLPSLAEWDDETPGALAIELATSAGLYLDPWQRFVLERALAVRPDDRWAAFEVGLICPRQNGKGSVLEALELAGLFLPEPDGPPPLLLHSAHEFKTSAEHFRRMRDLVDGSDHLRRQVRIIRTAAGSESIELTSGARLRFVTRTGGSGRGFSADLIVIDEAYNLTAEAMAAVLPTMSARPNPQVWYTSSAGMQASDQLARVRSRGLAGGDPRLAFFEWSAPDGADLDDREAWAQANPALGIRIFEDFVEAERATLPDEQFGRERMGLWATKQTASAIDLETWGNLTGPASAPLSPTFGVAVAPDRSWSAVAAAWRLPDGNVRVEVLRYAQTTSWVADEVARLRSKWGGTVVASTTARELVPDAAEPSTSAQALADNAFADLVTAGSLRHGNQGELNTAVKAARWKPSGDSRVLDRKGNVDISPLTAAALAVHAVTAEPKNRPGRFVSF